jgi:hypothetical protein
MKNNNFLLIPIVLGVFAIAACTNLQVIEDEYEEVVENPSQIYVNDEYNFTIEIPPGPYTLHDASNDSRYFLISSNFVDYFTEMSIAISDGSLDDRDKYPGGTLLSEENIKINDVNGKLLHYGYYLPGADEPVEGDGCPIYILDDEVGHLFTFNLHECLDSSIFEDVVNSFELLNE